MPEYPSAAIFDSLVDLVDDAAARWPEDRPTLSLRTDEGIDLAWSAAEVRRRGMLAAWRLRAIGLQPGDRLLTWSPSTPRLPATYVGAMRAGVVIVPLDLRMTKGVDRADLRPCRHDLARRGRRLRRAGPRRGRPLGLPGPRPRGPDRRPRRLAPRRLARPGRGLAAADAGVALRGGLHLRDDGRPEGRDAHPRQIPGDDRRLRAAASRIAITGRSRSCPCRTSSSRRRSSSTRRCSAPRSSTSARAIRGSSSRRCESRA